MHSAQLRQICFLSLLLLSFNTVLSQQFTEKANSYNIDLDGQKDGGFSFGDLNNDGFLDLVVNTSEDDAAHRTRVYFFNPQTQVFDDVTLEKCPACASEQAGSNFTERSLVIADFNNDGYKDFVRNNSKRLDVFLNNGANSGFTFGVGPTLEPNFFLFTTDLTSDNPPNGITNGMNTEGIGVLDYDNDGWLDLFIENHNWGMEIYRNTGDADNLFEYVSPEVTGLPAGVGAEVNDNFGERVSGDYAAVTDFNDDGYIDIIARKSSGIDFDLMQRDPNGMGFINGQDIQDAFNLNKGGVAFHDFDNDGDFDLIWTEAKQTLLYEQTPDGFTEITPERSGLDVSQATKIDGVAAGDVDNDGDIDIFLTDSLGSSFLFINQLNSREIGENTGTPLTFERNNLGIDLQADGEGCLFVDFDNDGDLDLYVNVKEGRNQYWENNLADNGSDDFLKVNVFENRIEEDRYALGATLTLKDICGDIISGIREVNGGSGHGTQDPSEVMLTLPNLTQQQYILNVKYPVYNGSRKEIDLLIEPGVKSIDVFPDMSSTAIADVNFKLNDDVFELVSSAELTSNLLVNDTLVFCPERSIRLLDNFSSLGEASILADGSFSFIANDTSADFSATFSYEVQCDACASKKDTANITINYLYEDDPGGSDCPDFALINPIFKTKDCLSPLESQIAVPASCDSISISILQTTLHGTFTLLDDQGNFSYVLSESDFIGTDSLTYSVLCITDECEKIESTTIFIDILPEEASIQLSDDLIDATTSNICGNSDLSYNIADNDVFENCVSTVFEIIEAPEQGEVSIDNEGNINYTLLNKSFKGTDNFTYKATCESCDNLADTAAVQIEIDCTTPPTVTDCDTLFVSDQSFKTKGCLSPLKASLNLSNIICDEIQIDAVIPAKHGDLQFSDVTGEFIYTLNDLDFVGRDSVTYSLKCSSEIYCDSIVESKIFIDVLPEEASILLVDDLPDDIGKFNTCADTIFTFDVGANDLFENCVSLDFEIVAMPKQGSAIIDDLGLVSYTLTEEDFIGFDTLSYSVTCESCENLTDTAVAIIEITRENGVLTLFDDLPNDSSGVLNTCVSDTLVVDVTANDTIENCQSTTFQIVDQPVNGQASIDGNGELTYVLETADFTGFDTLSYSVTCQSCEILSDTATVVVEVVTEPGKLVLLDDLPPNTGTFNTCAANEYSFNVSENDTTENCSNTFFEIVSQPTNGIASIDQNGIVSYTLSNEDFVGLDTLSYAVTCESCETLTDTAVAVIEIINTNQPIILLDTTLFTSCETDEVLSVSLGLENLFENCDSGTVAIIREATEGEAQINENGTFTYNLLSDTFSGVDTITYEVFCKGCEEQTVSASIFVEVECEVCEDISVENQTFEIESCGNEINDQLDPLEGCNTVSYTVITPPNQGSFTFSGNDDGSFTYILNNLEFNNIDSVLYQITCVKDCGEKSTTATIYFDLTNNTLEIPVITKLVTPNGDGFNDFLRINNIECYPNHVFKVFNRWGNLIFETDDYENTPEKGWSGQVNKNTSIAPGSFVGDGTYFCVLEFGNGNDVSEYVEIRGSDR